MDPVGGGLLLIVWVILVKEAGLPIPVPGDLIVIGAGIAAARGQLDPVPALTLIVVASIVGGIVQYALVRSVARPVLLRVVGRVASRERVDQQADRLRRGGARSVALARATPGVRIVTVAASALAAIPPIAFVLGLTTGNALFIAAHFGLGFAIGEPILRVIGPALGTLAIVGLVLATLGVLGWWLLTRRTRRAVRATEAGAVATLASWADACCPACLSLAAVEVSRSAR